MVIVMLILLVGISARTEAIVRRAHLTLIVIHLIACLEMDISAHTILTGARVMETAATLMRIAVPIIAILETAHMLNTA